MEKGKEKKENCKKEGVNCKWKEGKLQNAEGTFFFFFFFSLFKTTKICFGSTKMEFFYREKAFHAGKKSGKMTLPPQKNFPVTPLYMTMKQIQSQLGSDLKIENGWSL